MVINQKHILQHKVFWKSNTYTQKTDKYYITGPTKETADDFWRMVWEYKVQGIVILTRCVEMGKVK